MTDIFGQRFAWPLRVTPTGSLALIDGEDTLWAGIVHVLDTHQGSCPMDPRFGSPLQAYDPVAAPESIAWALGLAIERGAPRVKDVRVVIERYDAESATLWLRFYITPHGELAEYNRVYPYYTKVGDG